MVSVAVSKLAKTDLMFVQPGAKLNSVYYCENALEQGLLPAIRRILNNNFAFKQDRVPCTPLMTMSLTCIPMLRCRLKNKEFIINTKFCNYLTRNSVLRGGYTNVT